ncbi:hypothetical protein HDF16_000218 [Granulicella aggregans]|uniref:DUF3311 domain-containing protein n=1 Tax=Granulicella aggregans TaxID=474949 RepID=A0A7W8E1W4_9BACT|nr:DUF3311 domain-containing protein [Granulicella aggregans]MBB5055549.1 hypothetical protein [Granulicella aggregans]
MPPRTQSGTPRAWKLLLLLPYLGLCFPQLYTRAAPALIGFPFFYWYQFLWVVLTSAILALYYLRTRRDTTP